MAKYIQGIYTLANPSKYIGKDPNNIVFRSGWEAYMFKFLDSNPAILYWASESIQIPYKNPFTKRMTVYIPDLFIVYMDANGKQHAEVVEIKPLKETGLVETRSKRDQAFIALNKVKWDAARAWCAKNNFGFRVLTEQDIFHTGNRFTKPKKKRVVRRKK